MKLRSILAGTSLLLAAVPAFAQIKVNDMLTFTGWATGSYQYTSPSPGASFDSLNLDAALFSAIITPTKGVTATVSGYYRPSNEGGVSPGGGEFTILDAYVSYDAGNGVTLSAGKFLSNLGYESFYNISDNMISLANQAFLAPIPGYHEGFKLDYAVDKTTTVGFQIVDSLFPKPGYNATEGDGELKHNAGAEAYYTYTGIDGLTLWAGIGWDSAGNFEAHDVVVYDVWAAYAINKTNNIAVEEIYKDGGLIGTKGSNWLVYYQLISSDKFSTWFCVSGEDVSDGPSYSKYSVSPTYALTANLSVRAQYSYTSYHDFAWKSANFVGAEVMFKF
ncbi:MAG TPA: outer membrane beta-barrel protein [Opitutaceae bacterium]